MYTLMLWDSEQIHHLGWLVKGGDKLRKRDEKTPAETFADSSQSQASGTVSAAVLFPVKGNTTGLNRLLGR